MSCAYFIAKLDAPVIQGVGTQTFGCLEYKWSLSNTQKWIRKTLHIEIKFKPVNTNISNKEQVMYLCNFFHTVSAIFKYLHFIYPPPPFSAFLPDVFI